MGAALSRVASRLPRPPAPPAPPPSAFPARPRVPAPLPPAAHSEMEQARSIESLLNQATITSANVSTRGDAPVGMQQRNELVGELSPLELHQALALAADRQKWPADALASRFKANATLLEAAIEHCSAYMIVPGPDGLAYGEKRKPPGLSPRVGSAQELASVGRGVTDVGVGAAPTPRAGTP